MSLQKRPTINQDIVSSAVCIVAEKIGMDWESIFSEYDYPMDGFELMKALESSGYDIRREDMEAMDEIDDLCEKRLKEAEYKWFEENEIKPPFDIGTLIQHGVIVGICEHKAGAYLVKPYDTFFENHFRVINFEDASITDK